MRIIIEDANTIILAPSSSQADASSMMDASSFMDGGPPPAQLLQLLGAVSTGLPGGQGEGLQDAGPPPGWLSEAIGKAFEQDPGRFDTGAPSQGVGDEAPDASDGGKAPVVVR